MEQQTFLLGAGKGRILFPQEMLPTPEGYNSIHDDPHIRLLILQAGSERYAFVHIELNNIFEQGVEIVLNTIHETVGTETDHIFYHCLHVLETPHPERGTDPAAVRYNHLFFSAVRDAVKEACERAAESMQPARIGAAYAPCATINTNRCISTEEGWWLGSNEAIPVDKELTVIRLESLNGNPLAILFNCHSQSSIMDHSLGIHGERYITADLAGASAEFVESQFPGCIAMYLTGAGGDGCPSFQARRTIRGAGGKTWTEDLHEAGFLLVKLLGERLGSTVVQASESIVCEEADSIRMLYGRVDFEGRPRVPFQSITPRKSFDFSSDGSVRTMEPALLAIGKKVALAGVFAEITSETEMEIRKSSPFPYTAVLTFSQIGFHAGIGMGKYMASRDLYDKVAFQAMNSGVTAGSAEKLSQYMQGWLAESSAAMNAAGQ